MAPTMRAPMETTTRAAWLFLPSLASLHLFAMACGAASTPSSTHSSRADGDPDVPLLREIPRAREEMRRAFVGGAEGHAIAALPDGGAIAALSFFSTTDLGQGPIAPVRKGRNGLIVRLGPDGTVKWKTIADLWPKRVAIGPKGEAAIVGQEGVFVVGIDDGVIRSTTPIEGYPADATFRPDGELLVITDPPIRMSGPIDNHARIVSMSPRGPVSYHESLHRYARGLRSGPAGILEATWEGDDVTYLTRIGPDGRTQWETKLGGESVGRAELAIADDGHTIVLAGDHSRVLSVDTKGNIEWTHVFQRTAEVPGGKAVSIDAWVTLESVDVRGDDIVVGGFFLGDLTLGTETIRSHDVHVDPIVIGLDRRGELTWYARSAGEDVDSVSGVAWSANRRAWVVGTFLHSVAFGALPADTSDGTDHGYWAKLGAP